MQNDATKSQQFALLALRVSLGMLLVWWGLAKIMKPQMGVKIQQKFYGELFPSVDLQFGWGFVQVAIGTMVVVGLYRKQAVIGQLLITGFSSMMIWSALLDPFGLWLPVAKVAGMQHLFYPSVIALCGAAIMIAFRDQDRMNLDTWFKNRRGGDSDIASIPAE